MYQTNSTNNKGGIHNDLPIDLTLPIDRILILAFLGELSVENNRFLLSRARYQEVTIGKYMTNLDGPQ